MANNKELGIDFNNTTSNIEKSTDTIEETPEMKSNIITDIIEAGKCFHERITSIKEDFINKANELKNKGSEWGIDVSEQIIKKIEESYHLNDMIIKEYKITLLENEINAHNEKIKIAEKKLDELYQNYHETKKKIEEFQGDMNDALAEVDHLSA